MELTDRIIEAAEPVADETEIYFVEGTSVTTRLKRDAIHYAAGSKYQSLSIRVIRNGCIGVSATSSPDSWEECLKAAVASAGLASSQPWESLPGAAGIDQTPLNFDQDMEPDPHSALSLVQGMKEGASEHPVDITGGSADITVDSATLANSHGLCYATRRSLVSIGLETIKEQSTGYEFDNSWKMDLDPWKVGERAAFLAAASRGGKEIDTGEYDVVLSPVAFSQLLGGVFVPALSGRNVHAGRSRLASLLGRQVTDESISILDDPVHPRGLGSARWDAEGTPTKTLIFVENGILKEFAYDLKNAFRYGKKPTGSAVRGGSGGAPSIGVHNIRIEGPRDDLLDEKAIYVHDVVGAHTANPLTGDFSVELSNAFMVRGGQYEFPVRKAMLSGNVFDMLMEVGGLGREERVLGSLILPEIRLNGQRIIGGET